MREMRRGLTVGDDRRERNTMIAAILMGRRGSVGFPGKNLFPVLGRPLTVYPLLAAEASGVVDRIYVTTDCPEIKAIGLGHGCRIIERPPELCTREALGEQVYVHAWKAVRADCEREKARLELLVLLMANAPTVTGPLIREGVEVLRRDATLDSAVSVSAYNMWSPLRARREDGGGLLQPFVPSEALGDPKRLNCDRDSQGEVWFADMGVSVIRPQNLERLESGLLPQKWMGQRIFPLKQWGGLDIDFEWQIPQAEYWLRKQGFNESETPYKESAAPAR